MSVRRVFVDYFGLSKKSTHALQVLYLFLVIGSYVYNMYVSYFKLPSGVSGFRVGILTILFIASLVSFAIVCKADPGFITPNNVDLYMASFPRDRVLYATEKSCDTCGIEVRPPRSKHCSACRHCVAKMSHHCPWINRCVGERNMRWFLLYLISTSLYCVYSCWFIIILLHNYFVNYPSVHALLAQQRSVLEFIVTVIAVLFFRSGLLVPICIGALAASVCVVSYTVTVVMGVLINVTTSESFRIEEVEWRASKGFNGDEEFDLHLHYPDLPLIHGRYIHAYDHGWRHNLDETIHPPCCSRGQIGKFE